jgi:hypothetical protein
VVKSFIAEYHSPWWIPYSVSCVIVHQTGVIATQAPTISTLISADLGNAFSAIAGSAISLNSLQTALFSPNAMTVGTSNQMQAVAAVGATQDAINSQIAAQSELLSAPIAANAAPSGSSQTLAAIVISAGLLASAVNARSYVGRIGRNLNGSRD